MLRGKHPLRDVSPRLRAGAPAFLAIRRRAPCTWEIISRMTVNIYYEADCPAQPGEKVAILGYGSQGHAHALNLKDSGVDVRVGLRPDSPNAERARKAGLIVDTVAEVSKWADVIMNLTPDQTAAKVYHAEIVANMKPNV